MTISRRTIALTFTLGVLLLVACEGNPHRDVTVEPGGLDVHTADEEAPGPLPDVASPAEDVEGVEDTIATSPSQETRAVDVVNLMPVGQEVTVRTNGEVAVQDLAFGAIEEEVELAEALELEDGDGETLMELEVATSSATRAVVLGGEPGAPAAFALDAAEPPTGDDALLRVVMATDALSDRAGQVWSSEEGYRPYDASAGGVTELPIGASHRTFTFWWMLDDGRTEAVAGPALDVGEIATLFVATRDTGHVVLLLQRGDGSVFPLIPLGSQVQLRLINMSGRALSAQVDGTVTDGLAGVLPGAVSAYVPIFVGLRGAPETMALVDNNRRWHDVIDTAPLATPGLYTLVATEAPDGSMLLSDPTDGSALGADEAWVRTVNLADNPVSFSATRTTPEGAPIAAPVPITVAQAGLTASAMRDVASGEQHIDVDIDQDGDVDVRFPVRLAEHMSYTLLLTVEPRTGTPMLAVVYYNYITHVRPVEASAWVRVANVANRGDLTVELGGLPATSYPYPSSSTHYTEQLAGEVAVFVSDDERRVRHTVTLEASAYTTIAIGPDLVPVSLVDGLYPMPPRHTRIFNLTGGGLDLLEEDETIVALNTFGATAHVALRPEAAQHHLLLDEDGDGQNDYTFPLTPNYTDAQIFVTEDETWSYTARIQDRYQTSIPPVERTVHARHLHVDARFKFVDWDVAGRNENLGRLHAWLNAGDIPGLAFGNSPPTAIPSGEHNLTARVRGEEQTFFDGALNFEGGGAYTLMTTRTGDAEAFTVRLLEDPVVHDTTRTLLRITHVAPNVGPATLHATQGDASTPLVDGLAPGESRLVEVDDFDKITLDIDGDGVVEWIGESWSTRGQLADVLVVQNDQGQVGLVFTTPFFSLLHGHAPE